MTIPDTPHGAVIAVVDDDQLILESLESLLESADYDVRPFSSAAALLESGVLPEIDCLISDVAMPAMDGFELARAVRAARPVLPVILVTGRHDLLDRSFPDTSGRYRVLKKPFSGEELLAALAEALRSS
jgi:FixJ family two-component response regulator